MKHQKLFTTLDISNRISKVKLKKNKSETKLAKFLWENGYRYRLNDKALPGSPDIVLYKYKIAIFVDGEFWHGKNWSNRKTKLKSNRNYWIEKIEENMTRDIKNDNILKSMGWTPIHFWTEDINNDLDSCLNILNDFIDIFNEGRNLDDY